MGDTHRNPNKLNLSAIKDSTDVTAWTAVKGNSLELTYYAGIEAGNPSGTKNIKRIIYKKDGNTVLYKELTYDALDDVLTVSTY